MSLLVFGQSGQVARELATLVPDATFLSRADADLLNPEACAAQIRNSRADVVINAAAWTAVDAAETDADAAHCVNARAPTAMAAACARQGIPFIHISTDYVFPGTGVQPFRPTDPTGPLGQYGASKRAGEDGVRAAGGVFAILRTSWVFSAHGQNFVKTMLRLSETRGRLSVVGDQVGGPTFAGDIAQACVSLADRLIQDRRLTGTYHFTGAPDVSWADFAREIFRLTSRPVEVVDIPTSEYPTPARRPLNSRLDCSATEAAFGLQRPDWRSALARVLDDLKASP